MRSLEQLCGTAGKRHLDRAGLMRGLEALGYAVRLVFAPPSPAWVMNSAWGGLISPAACGPYIAASTDQTIIIDTPGAWEQPSPAGDDDMTAVLALPNGDVHRFLAGGPGHLFEYQDLASGVTVGPNDISADNHWPGVPIVSGLAATYNPSSGNEEVQWISSDGHLYKAHYDRALHPLGGAQHRPILKEQP